MFTLNGLNDQKTEIMTKTVTQGIWVLEQHMREMDTRHGTMSISL
jgi:hypothetical protein